MLTRKSIEVSHLTVNYHEHKALDSISLSLPEQQLVGIIGPNGAGKSTLIKSMLGMIPSSTGSISVFEQSIKKVRNKIAYVPQRNQIDMDFPVLVEDVVIMGRYPRMSWWRRPNKRDREIAYKCLEEVGMADLRKRQIGELSGGQQQRVFIARALAQEAELFFLDEPFAGIDISSEEIIFNILLQLKSEGKTLLVVHHDLSKVEQYFDSLIILNKELIAFGKTKEVFEVENIQRAYQGNVAVLPDDGSKTMVVNR